MRGIDCFQKFQRSLVLVEIPFAQTWTVVLLLCIMVMYLASLKNRTSETHASSKAQSLRYHDNDLGGRSYSKGHIPCGCSNAGAWRRYVWLENLVEGELCRIWLRSGSPQKGFQANIRSCLCGLGVVNSQCVGSGMESPIQWFTYTRPHGGVIARLPADAQANEGWSWPGQPTHTHGYSLRLEFWMPSVEWRWDVKAQKIMVFTTLRRIRS